jgi:hypothetical protein
MPSVHHMHPEFGYLCPTPRLRRDVRVAVVSIVLGTVIGAGVVTLRAIHDRDTETAMAMTHVVHSSVDGAVNEAASGASKPEAIRVDRVRIESPKPDAAKPANANAANAKVESAKVESAKIESAKIESTKIESTKIESAKIDGRNVDGGKADAAKAGCGDNSYLDGTCLAAKPRRVRVRVATDGPATAPIGRPSSTNVNAPAAAKATPNVAQSQATPSQAAPAPGASADAGASQPSAAAPRKPHRIAHSEPRHRSDRARDGRAAPNGRGMFANNAGGPFGGFFGGGWPWQ